MPTSNLDDTRFILESLRWRRDDGTGLDVTSPYDWDSLVVTAIVLGLAPQLHRSLEGREQDVPVGVMARLAASREAHALRADQIFEQCGQVINALHDVGVRPVALKGLHTAALFYAEPGFRPMNDLDLLVTDAETARVRTVLQRLGYEERYTSPEFGPGVTKHTSTFRRPAAEPSAPNPFLFTSDDRTIEPHTSLEESWFGLRVDVSAGMAERAVDRQLHGHPCHVLATEDLVLHLCVHLCFHLIMGRPSMLQLTDLLTVVSRVEIDWDVMIERAIACDAAPYAHAALLLAVRLLGAPVPSRVVELLSAATPAGLRRQADRLDLRYVMRRTRRPPMRHALSRVRRGFEERAEAARWARDGGERWRVWQTALRVTRTDTMRLWLGHTTEGAHES